MKTLIKGTDIFLYQGSTIKTVENVLIGEPTTSESESAAVPTGTIQEYTLAIPKGNTDDWTNRIVRVPFYPNVSFRTVGYPLEGIEENIPLDWNKKVKIRRIALTGSCTIYSKTDYSRHVIERVYCHDERAAAPSPGIAQARGGLHVTIYADRYRSDNYKPTIGDIIAVGNQEFEFDTSTQQTTSESMKAFRESGVVFGVISEIITESCGPLPDYIITAR